MSVTLGGVTLPDLILEGPDTHSPVMSSVQWSLGGRLLVQEKAIVSGMPIDLVALEDGPWLTRADVDALLVLTQSVNQGFTLTHEIAEYTVRFRFQEAPVIDVTPLYPVFDIDSGTLYTGRIKLQTL